MKIIQKVQYHLFLLVVNFQNVPENIYLKVVMDKEKLPEEYLLFQVCIYSYTDIYISDVSYLCIVFYVSYLCIYVLSIPLCMYISIYLSLCIGMGWFPLKVYRPCPALIDAGYGYVREGQTFGEIVAGKSSKKE